MPTIKSVFSRKEKPIFHHIELFVRVLKKIPPNTYWIGDDTGTCQMKIDSEVSKIFPIVEGQSYRLWFRHWRDEERVIDEERIIVILEKSEITNVSWKVKVPYHIAMQIGAKSSHLDVKFKPKHLDEENITKSDDFIIFARLQV